MEGRVLPRPNLVAMYPLVTSISASMEGRVLPRPNQSMGQFPGVMDGLLQWRVGYYPDRMSKKDKKKTKGKAASMEGRVLPRPNRPIGRSRL